MEKLISYVCGCCLQDVEADPTMPYLAKHHVVPQTVEEVAQGKKALSCMGVGFPTKKNVMEVSDFLNRVPQTFSSVA